MARRICILTGTRAEYGLLYWLIRRIKDDPVVDLKLLVTGMHLSPEFGYTVREIEKDGFPIGARVEMLLSSDSPAGLTKSIGVATIGFADALDRLHPDLLVLLGDRVEVLAAAQAALVARIPTAHLHGGELTEGAIDEAVRHAVTKMAHLHFVANEVYGRRVVQLGEQPDRVFVVGTPGLDHLSQIEWMTAEDLGSSLGFRIAHPFFLVTYHPVTLESDPSRAMAELLAALDAFPDASVLITYPNADTDSRRLIEMAEAHAAAHPDRIRTCVSLGQRRYLSAMRLADVIVGNSSSGLTEAPALRRPTVNLGDRQRGRLKADSIINCVEERHLIESAIRKALSAEFRAGLHTMNAPYGETGASERIAKILKTAPLEDILKKRFHDL